MNRSKGEAHCDELLSKVIESVAHERGEEAFAVAKYVVGRTLNDVERATPIEDHAFFHYGRALVRGVLEEASEHGGACEAMAAGMRDELNDDAPLIAAGVPPTLQERESMDQFLEHLQSAMGVPYFPRQIDDTVSLVLQDVVDAGREMRARGVDVAEDCFKGYAVSLIIVALARQLRQVAGVGPGLMYAAGYAITLESHWLSVEGEQASRKGMLESMLRAQAAGRSQTRNGSGDRKA